MCAIFNLENPLKIRWSPLESVGVAVGGSPGVGRQPEIPRPPRFIHRHHPSSCAHARERHFRSKTHFSASFWIK